MHVSMGRHIYMHKLTANALAKLTWVMSCFTDAPRFGAKKGTSTSAPMSDITAPIRAPKKENPHTCSEENRDDVQREGNVCNGSTSAPLGSRR